MNHQLTSNAWIQIYTSGIRIPSSWESFCSSLSSRSCNMFFLNQLFSLCAYRHNTAFCYREKIGHLGKFTVSPEGTQLFQIHTYTEYFRKVYRSLQVRVPRNIMKYLSIQNLPQKQGLIYRIHTKKSYYV